MAHPGGGATPPLSPRRNWLWVASRADVTDGEK
jgi:hypothetical protein